MAGVATSETTASTAFSNRSSKRHLMAMRSCLRIAGMVERNEMGTARYASKRRLDYAGADDVRSLATAVRTTCVECFLMCGAAIFILKLIKHAVVAMRRAQSAISENRVRSIWKCCIKQRHPQHAFWQSEYAAQARKFDFVAHRCYARRRINARADQMHEHVAGQHVGARELPQNRDKRFPRHQPLGVERTSSRKRKLPLIKRENGEARRFERHEITPLRARAQSRGGTEHSRSAEPRESTRPHQGSSPEHP
jgi:hypothetical protein